MSEQIGLTEEDPRKRYELSRGEYEGYWHQRLRQVFRVPEDLAAQEKWPRIPERVFQGGLELAFVQEPLTWKKGFQAFTSFLDQIGESGFAFVSGPDRDLCFAFPADIDWDNCRSLRIGAGAYYYFLFGPSGRWGFHHSEYFGICTVGYNGTEILKAMQEAFGFEGRNTKLIEVFDGSEGSTPHTSREARLYHKLANRLRKENPDTRADWNPEDLAKPIEERKQSIKEGLRRAQLLPIQTVKSDSGSEKSDAE
jgi:hypothetical protein